jgi:hypothetical protein
MEINELSPQLKGAKTRLLNELEKTLKISALRMEGRSKQVAFSRFRNQTGRLRQSIAGRFAYIDGKPTAILQAGGAFGGSDVNYAEYIEFGTRFIKPRLFLGRSVAKEQEELKPKLNKLLEIALFEG